MRRHSWIVAVSALLALSPAAIAQDAPQEPEPDVDEGCIAHEITIRTGDEYHDFQSAGCAHGETYEGCLSYELTIVSADGTFHDAYDECAPEEGEGPAEGEPCLEYALRIRTASHDVIVLPGECPPSTPSCVEYELMVWIGDEGKGQGTYSTDCELSPCQAEGLVAVANEDGSVTLTWPGDEDALYEVMRAVDGGPVEPHAVVTGTTFVDSDTTSGSTYFYVVHRPGRDGSSMCAEVTAVPFFGAPLVGGLAAAGATGAFAWMRRRRG